MDSLLDTLREIPKFVHSQPACIRIPLHLVVFGLLVLVLWKIVKKIFFKERSGPVTHDWEQGVAYLYQFPPVPSIVNLSPFCLKLETYLRLAGIKYQNKYVFRVRSKEGTLPFLEIHGNEYPDSGLCISNLQKMYKKEEKDLSPEQQGIGRALEQMMEQNTIRGHSYFRYGEHFDEILSDKMFGRKLPWFFSLMKSGMKKNVVKSLKIHGIGKHSRKDIKSITEKDLRAIANILGDQKFIFGDKIHRVDCTLFGHLAQMIYVPIDTPQRRLLQEELTVLKDYVERIKDTLWPDWDEVCASKPNGLDYNI